MGWEHLEWIHRCATDAAADLAVIRGKLTDGDAIDRVGHAQACLEEIVNGLRLRPAPETVVECGGR